MPATDLTLSLHQAISELPAAEWDACAGPDNPFISHGFLCALEASASVGPGTGWQPLYAAFRAGDGTLAACAPMYVKGHSYGEYVFDHAWARAFEQAGGRYYPKLQICSPFSPVPGARLLRRDPSLPVATLGQALIEAARGLKVSSLHLTFCQEAEWRELGQAGFLQRIGVQYHWHNQGFASFEDFLGALASRKRKNLRRERRDALSTGLHFETLQGSAITETTWDAFYAFYLSTSDRKWGSPYLTRAFFSELGARLGDRVVLMLASNGSHPVAGALNLLGGDTLYGRNWGCLEDHKFLHFELCYYRAIDFAISHGLARVEAGAQGEHKIQRGYLPATTYSAHWIAHAGLSRAVDGFLREERAAVQADMAVLSGLSPYRQAGADDAAEGTPP